MTSTLARPSERVVRNDGIDIAVFEYGDSANDTVVLVHGWPDTHHLWEEVVPLLVERFHVVSYDTRGHGASTNPSRWQDFALEKLASDFFAVLDAVSPDGPVHVLAHDWGSVQVWEAVCEPGAEARVASFTSVSGPNLDHLAWLLRRRLSRPTPRNLAVPLRQLAASGYTFLFQLPVLPKALFGATVNDARWRRFLRVAEGTDASRVHLSDTFKDDLISGLRIYRANVGTAFTSRRDRRTSVPVQLIVNQRDVAVRPAVYDEEARWTDRLWRRDIAAGHWSPFSHPQVLAAAVTELADALAGETPARELRRAEVGGDRRRFEDQLVVVTGAGSGIGRETALAFGREGAEIVACDINLGAARETVGLLEEAGAAAHAYELDVSDEDAVAALADLVAQRHGVADVLVNNAGIAHAGGFFDTTSAEFQRVLDVNLNGVVYGCRHFGRRMVERGLGGHIVNLASLAAWAPQQAMGPYATSKSGVLMFSECLRAELASAGVGVSAICPGVVHTNITATTHFSGVSADEEARRQYRADRVYARRGYTPDRVAKQIVKAVVRDRAVMPVTPESYQGYYLWRLAPGVVRRFARVDLSTVL